MDGRIERNVDADGGSGEEAEGRFNNTKNFCRRGTCGCPQLCNGAYIWLHRYKESSKVQRQLHCSFCLLLSTIRFHFLLSAILQLNCFVALVHFAIELLRGFGVGSALCNQIALSISVLWANNISLRSMLCERVREVVFERDFVVA